MNIGYLILFIISISALITWIYYVMHNTFEIILLGLRNSFYLWFFHLTNILITLLLCFPLLIPDNTDWLYTNKTLCWVWGRIWIFTMSFSWYSVTLFSYQKVRIYFQLRYKSLMWCFSSFVHFLGFILYIASVVVTTTGPSEINGEKSCVRNNSISPLIMQICIIHYIICNMVMLSIFWYNAETMSDDFPSLELELQVNKNFVPMMFISTVIAYLTLFVLIGLTQESQVLAIIAWIVYFADAIFNNFIMHHTLLSHSKFVKLEDKIRAQVQNASNENDSEDSESLKCWVALPGLLPIQMTQCLVEDHDLWEHVVTDVDMLEQVERLKTMWCFNTLSWVCQTDDELLRMIEMYE